MASSKNNPESLELVPSADSDNFDIFLDAILKQFGDESEIPLNYGGNNVSGSMSAAKTDDLITTNDLESENSQDENPEEIFNSKAEMGVQDDNEDENSQEQGNSSHLPKSDSAGTSGEENLTNRAHHKNKDTREGKFYLATKDLLKKKGTRERANDDGADVPATQPSHFVLVPMPDERGEELLENRPENDPEELVAAEIPTNLRIHFNTMALLMLTPPVEKQAKFVNGIKWVAFLIASVMTIVSQLQSFKAYFLEAWEKGNLYHNISLLYNLNTILLQLLFLRIILTNRLVDFYSNAEKLLQEAESSKTGQREPERKESCLMLHWTSLLSLVSAFAMGTGLNTFIQKFDPTDVVQSKAYRLIVFSCAWKRNTYTEDADDIWDKAGEVKSQDVGLMCIQMSIEFFGWLNLLMIKDILPAASFDINNEADHFRAFLKSVDALDSDVIDEIEGRQDFLYKFSTEHQNCFGILFLSNHFHNLLFCAYSLADLIKSDFNLILFIVRLVVIVKIVWGYWKSIKAFGTGGMAQQTLYNLSRGQGRRMREQITFLVEKAKHRPVGIGAGMFMVTQDFGFRYVISWFLCFLRGPEDGAA